MERTPRGHFIVEKILEVLQAHAEFTVNLLDVFTSSYGESYRKLRRIHAIEFKTSWAESYREDQRFYTLMNKLKQQGFVVREKQKKGTLWKLTKRGKGKWNMLQERKKWSVPLYEKENDGILRIVTFDVPEQERKKRTWLQATLKSLGFNLLQKSVWMGTYRVPKEFLYDLREKRMLKYVHIIEVGKSGTLEELKVREVLAHH